MTDFDPSIPHDLSLVTFRDPQQGLSMTYGATLGASYSAGNTSGQISRMQLMPGGYIVATVRRTQGRVEEIGTETRVLMNGWVSAEFVPVAVVREEKGPTAAQERARERAAKAVQTNA